VEGDVTEQASSGRRGRAGELIVRARLFSDARPGIGAEGELAIGSAAVTFQSGDAITELPVAGLVARVSGFDDKTLFLSHPAQPGIEISTTDPSAVGAPAVAALPSLAASLRANRASRRRFWGCVAAAVVAALLVLLVAIAGFGLGVESLRRLFGAP
jgi:hypothetical protein